MSSSHMDEFYDIYGIWHVPWWQLPLVKNILWMLAAVLLISLIVYIIKKFANRKKPLTPWQVALRDLAILGTPDMLNERSSKIFYIRLTTIVKKYLCDRYGFDIYGKTDREILLFLDEQVIFPRDLMPVLYEIYDHASQSKFANVLGIAETMKRDLALGVRIVKETMQSQSQ